MTPHPHQLKMLEGTQAGWREFRRQMVVCPTGGGKTPFFAWIAKAMLPGRTLILAHREELIEQAIDKVFAAIGIRAEKEKAEHCASLDARIVVGSVQSLCRAERRQRWPRNHFSLVVVDETHRILADSYRAIIDHFDSRLLGVTATPSRADKRNLGEVFENIACEIPLYTRSGNPNPGLVNSGYLSPITIDLIPLHIDLSAVGTSMDLDSGCKDFNKQDLDSVLTPHLNEIARQIKARASDRMTLGFAPLIETARKASEACNNAGLISEYVYGEDPQRAEKLERFKNWEYDILWNSMLLTEGYDNPPISCIVPLRLTRSTGLYAQMVGRGTRLDVLKDDLKVMDFLYQSGKHNICRPAHLIAESQEEAETIMEIAEQQSAMPASVVEQLPLELQSLATAATQQREERLRKRLEENRKKAGKFISAEEFALQHHRMDVAEFEPVVGWHSLPVTDPQARALRRAKIDPETVSGRGHASALLNVHFQTQTITLASPRQRQKMRQMGYENADQATEAEARRFFAGLRGNAVAA
jgi:superfamily II DNA or RNA helicase